MWPYVVNFFKCGSTYPKFPIEFLYDEIIVFCWKVRFKRNAYTCTHVENYVCDISHSHLPAAYSGGNRPPVWIKMKGGKNMFETLIHPPGEEEALQEPNDAPKLSFRVAICGIYCFLTQTWPHAKKKETVVHMLSAALQSPVTDLQVPRSKEKWGNAVSNQILLGVQSKLVKNLSSHERVTRRIRCYLAIFTPRKLPIASLSRLVPRFTGHLPLDCYVIVQSKSLMMS